MAKEVIVHLSDVHSGVHFIMNRSEAMGIYGMSPEEFLARQIGFDVLEELGLHPTLIIISGDLTQAGQRRQFSLVGGFLSVLLPRLSRAGSSPLTPADVVIVPGNHDINFVDNRRAYDSARGHGRRMAAENCPQKLGKFRHFADHFYSGTSHTNVYDAMRGWQHFLYPRRGLAVVGFDSCRNISHKSRRAAGVVYNRDIEDAAAALPGGASWPLRIAVIHHNPYSIGSMTKAVQNDFLHSAEGNVAALWSEGFGCVFHGHRHVNAAAYLLERSDNATGALISIGAGTIGSKGQLCRYQVVELECGAAQWTAKIHARMLDVDTGAVTPVGRGRFVQDPTVARTILTAEAPKLGSPGEGGALTNELAVEPDQLRVHLGGLDGVDPAVTFERLQLLNVLYDLESAAAALEVLSGRLSSWADRELLDVLREDHKIRRERAMNALSDSDVRRAYQELFNRLHAPRMADGQGKGALPHWAFESEKIRIAHELLVAQTSDLGKLIPAILHHTNELRTLFETSGKRDHMSCYRRIILLLEAHDLPHARQALQIAFAVAPHWPLYRFASAILAVHEHRFADALEDLHGVDALLPPGADPPNVAFWKSYCHYFNGDLEEAIRLAEEGMTKWPHITGFRNNFAFARMRQALAKRGSGIWDDASTAARILDDLFLSIVRIGTFSTAHFNYALLLYWAEAAGALELARKVVARHGRPDLVGSEALVSKAFDRARNALLAEHDTFRAAMATYFNDRAKAARIGTFRERILDELLWDADNFISVRYEAEQCLHSFLSKNKAVVGEREYDHFTTLKRWRVEGELFDVAREDGGGGYYLRWNGKGVVINPGAGFLKTFRERGYSISEIDAIVVTAADYTAYEELNRLLFLVQRAYETRPKEERVEVLLERRVFYRFPDLHLRSAGAFVGPQVLVPGVGVTLCGSVEVLLLEKAREAPSGGGAGGCGDGMSTACTAAVLQLVRSEEVALRIGLCWGCWAAGDEWEQLLECNLLVYGVGSVTPHDLFRDGISTNLEADLVHLFSDDPLYRRSFGLGPNVDLRQLVVRDSARAGGAERPSADVIVGIDGLQCVASGLRQEGALLIIGDLPVELGDKRHRIAYQLNGLTRDAKNPRRVTCLTEDTGLVISLPQLEVLCEMEQQFTPRAEVDEECREGDLTGPVRHFCRKHRIEPGFGEFIAGHE